MGAFTRSRYAGFLYLNDDFEGGELVFKGEDGNDGLTIKPKTGMFAIFHGGCYTGSASTRAQARSAQGKPEINKGFD